ncbi:MAG: nucleoside-diphosphate-sugar epimerase [Zhongshania aliphaticivorans]|jgi:nucleoside-diphosphate-sugar epimerase
MKALVTGGGGFVGSYVVERLLARGYAVRSFGRSSQPSLEERGVEVHCGDLADADAVAAASDGMDVVFHVAARAGVWGSWQSYYRPNVIGTRNVVAACQVKGVRRLIYTSTPSVVFNRKAIRGGDETLSYGRRWLCHYAHTKAIAEEEALAANSDALKVVALRPHLVFGPGDPHLLPRVVDSACSGRLKIVGNGRNKVDVSYVEDVADAHINALDALEAGKGAGCAYFISQDEPVELWPWVNSILEGLGYAPLTRKVRLPLAYGAGTICEFVWNVLKRRDDPPMTRFVAVELAKDHYFDISAAKSDLGYVAKVPMEEALRLTVNDLKKRGY